MARDRSPPTMRSLEECRHAAGLRETGLEVARVIMAWGAAPPADVRR
ncbi:MAG: hypothetical protein OXQ29_19115 [Rhodospirillaceae bacterium]|nr:hypothetical protein [Rhodospirillaceae bacterium]